MISKQNKRKVKKANQASLLSVENKHNWNPKKIVEVKDKWESHHGFWSCGPRDA